MLKGPPPHPPGGGLGGRTCARSAHTPARCGVRASFASRVTGGAGAPARGLRSARCTPGGPPTRTVHTVAARAACRARTRGRSRALLNPGTTAQRRRPGTGRPSPARALRALVATRVTGGPKARSTARPPARRVRQPRHRQRFSSRSRGWNFAWICFSSLIVTRV
jgi:hypothetical protein